MGKVVKLEKPAARPAQRPKPARRRGRRSKTALVLGGGGVTGGVYEIGALRALDLLAVNRTINEFDVYVGTSAGSFVASLAANGVTPEEMMRVVNQQTPTPFRDINMGTVLKVDYPNLAKSLAARTSCGGSPNSLPLSPTPAYSSRIRLPKGTR
jgi:NTE family protein